MAYRKTWHSHPGAVRRGHWTGPGLLTGKLAFKAGSRLFRSRVPGHRNDVDLSQPCAKAPDTTVSMWLGRGSWVEHVSGEMRGTIAMAIFGEWIRHLQANIDAQHRVVGWMTVFSVEVGKPPSQQISRLKTLRHTQAPTRLVCVACCRVGGGRVSSGARCVALPGARVHFGPRGLHPSPSALPKQHCTPHVSHNTASPFHSPFPIPHSLRVFLLQPTSQHCAIEAPLSISP